MKRKDFVFLLFAALLVFPLTAYPQDYKKFQQDFRDAVMQEDYNQMKAVVAAAKPDDIYLAFMDFVSSFLYYGIREDTLRKEEQLDFMKKLARSHSQVHNDADYETYTNFLTDKPPEVLNEVKRSHDTYNRAYELFRKAMQTKTDEDWVKAEEMAKECLTVAQKAGDIFYVGNAGLLASVTFKNRQKKDYEKQAEYLKIALDAFTEFGSKRWKDAVNEDIAHLPKEGKAYLNKLRGKPAEGEGGEGTSSSEEGEEGESGKFVTKWLDYGDFRFMKMKKSFETFSTPSPFGWAEFMLWSQVTVPKGTEVAFADKQIDRPFSYSRYLLESLNFDPRKDSLLGKMKLVNSDNKIYLNTGTGEAHERMDLTTSFKTNTFEIDYGEGIKCDYAVTFRELGEENFLGIQRMTFCDTTNERAIAYQRACYMEGSVLEGDYKTDMILIDDNNDGTYDDYGMDTLIIGDPDRGTTTFVSKFIPVKDKIFALKVHPSGTSVRLREYGGPTGEILLKYNRGKVKPSFLIVKGAGGTEVGNTFFNCPLGQKVKVPEGEYSFHFGFIMKGTGRQASTVQIRRGDAKPFYVKENELTTVELGHPFMVSGKPHRTRTSLGLKGSEIKVKGKVMGEEYCCFYPDILQPTYTVRRENGGILQKEKKMRRAERTDYVQNRESIWFPKDVDMETKGYEGIVEVRYGGDHPLLGRLSGEWH